MRSSVVVDILELDRRPAARRPTLAPRGPDARVLGGDIANGDHVMVNIGKFTGAAFRSLGELVERDMLSPQVADFLSACVRSRCSIVFAGPPGSGKTTLMSCCCADLDPTLRVVIAEEVFEADVPVANVG